MTRSNGLLVRILCGVLDEFCRLAHLAGSQIGDTLIGAGELAQSLCSVYGQQLL
jgi:hypothetical protein